MRRRLNLRAGPLDISAIVPDRLAGRLLRLKRQVQTRCFTPGGPSPVGQLTVLDHVPALHLQRRNAADAVSLLLPAAEADRQRSSEGSSSARVGDDLRTRVESLSWYHTIDLPGGIVTPGVFDHRPLLEHYGLPATLEGKRALDVATFDGFWAFEMERRGAEVTAVDVPRLSSCDLPLAVRDALSHQGVDPPTGEGFKIALTALNSRVHRLEKSVYDLDSSELGTFDFVHVADLLVHLENPLAALRAIRRVTDGTALVVDCFDRHLKGNLTEYHGGWRGLTWWVPSLDTLAQMMIDAGFAEVKVHVVYSLPFVDELSGPWRAALVATT